MSKVLVDRELPEPYGWIAVGELYMIRENAIRAAGKTSCIGVYTRPQLLAALSAVTAERDRLREDRDSQQRVCIAEMEKANQLRAEVEGIRAQRDKMAQILRDLVPGCKWRFMRPRIDQALQEVGGGN